MLQRVRADAEPAAGAALARVVFGARHPAAAPDETLTIQVPLEPLHEDGAWCDIFSAAAGIERSRAGDVELATDGYRLAGCVRLDENAAGGLRAAASRAYASIFAALDRHRCGTPLRFWNYVPRINAPLEGLERYRHFNVGRQEAFLAAGKAAFAGAPAACALGSFADELVVYFLAARAAPIAIENPRQVSAYHYPADYGPRSPTFSRATLLPGVPPWLLISGTASIVGHRSQHPGDVVAQTHETFANLRAVIDAANAANKRSDAGVFALERLTYTVYVRERADLAAIRTTFLAEVGAQSHAARNALFLRADICRSDLRVEIEATGHAG